jgi:hypothetical protein
MPETVATVEKVTVLNQDFEITRVLESRAALDRFNELWATKQVVENSPQNIADAGWKLDIVVGGESSRWLYSPTGRVVRLSARLQPVYHFGDPSKINAILGLRDG